MTFFNRFIQYRNSHRVKYTREYVPVYGLSTKSQGWIAEVTTGEKVLDIFVAFLIIIIFFFPYYLAFPKTFLDHWSASNQCAFVYFCSDGG